MESIGRRPRLILLFLYSATLLLVIFSVWDSGLQWLQTTLMQLNTSAWDIRQHKSEGSEPLIFLYNKFFSSVNWNAKWDNVNGSNALRTLTDCPVKCRFTSSRNLLHSADLVLVSLAYYKSHGGKPVNITYTNGDQIWTGFQLESPVHGGGYEAVDGIFDWVATYRRDSDIYVPYGKFHSLTGAQGNTSLSSMRKSLRLGDSLPYSIWETPFPINLSTLMYACSQKKLAAWLVSNCGARSKRDNLVQNLMRYIPVDVFGGCSKRKCPETEKLSCRDYLGQNYKFYLAFENSLCLDYVTEKFFLAYQHNMIPVTFGLANYSLYGPPGSYINAMDFNSVEDLAKYLLYLDENDDEYLNYFSWRGRYRVEPLDMNNLMCIVCQTIHDYMKKKRGNSITTESGGKKYPSFRKWHESFPSPQTRALHQIGKNITLRSTEVCLDPMKYPVLEKWIGGRRKPQSLPLIDTPTLEQLLKMLLA